jgi:putative multiple sugar transport system ATP-binding protein
MVGRDMTHRFPPREAVIGETLLEIKNWKVRHPIFADRMVINDVSINVKRGEVVGIAGLMGAGRTEFAMSVFGHSYGQGIGGEVLVHGKKADTSTVDRAVATEEVRRFRVRTPSVQTRAVNLSGGNQQKVVLGKWLAMSPRVLILDEPTRGIDVGAKSEIYRHMSNLASQGITILMVSSEMEEIIGMSNRVVVMHERGVKGILSAGELTQERIAQLMTGNSNVKKEASA